MVNKLAEKFNRAYPNYATSEFHQLCRIEEPTNRETKHFQELILSGVDGYAFPHEIANKMSSFAKSAGHTQWLQKDCDGILLTEKDDKKYVILCELKSKFSKDEIADAKDQLVGSYINLMGVLSTLQDFDRNSFVVKGIIASFSPTQEDIDALTKNEDHKSSFAIQLHHKNFYRMPAMKCDRYFYPFNVGDFDIYYVPVPNRDISHSIDLPSLIGI